MEKLFGSKLAEPQFGIDLNPLVGLAQKILPLILYLCSDEPEVRPLKESRGSKKKKNTSAAYGLKEAERVMAMKVGYDLGEQLQEAEKNWRISPDSATRRTPAPHVCSAHWHGFWRGSKKAQDKITKKRDFFFKWLHPIFVGVKHQASTYNNKGRQPPKAKKQADFLETDIDREIRA